MRITDAGRADGYQRYLQSAAWKTTRRLALERNGYRCSGCDETEHLEVHHLTYERLGHERPTDLMVLCGFCHAREHGRSPRAGGPIAGHTTAEFARYAQVRDDARRRAPLAECVERMASKVDALVEGIAEEGLMDRSMAKLIRALRYHVEELKRKVYVHASVREPATMVVPGTEVRGAQSESIGEKALAAALPHRDGSYTCECESCRLERAQRVGKGVQSRLRTQPWRI